MDYFSCIIETSPADAPGESQDDPDEKWKTYRDYLKRKRDYKREWRKRRTQQAIPYRKPRLNRDVQVMSAPQPQLIPRPEEDINSCLEIIGNPLPTEEPEAAEVYHIEEELPFEEEVVEAPNPDPPVLDDDEEDIIEYNHRSRLVFESLEALPLKTRLNLLTLIEGLLVETSQ